MFIREAAAVLALAAPCLTATAANPTIYATNHQGNYPNFGDTLIRFSADNPAAYETIGSLVVAKGFGGLEFDGSGNLWGYASHNSFGGASSGLYKINTSTGAATQQGTLSSQTLTDLGWNPANSTMYGVYSQGLMTARLYTVNLTTGAVAVAGTFTGLDPDNNLAGLAFDSDGTIYVYDNYNNKFYVSDEFLHLTLLYGPDDTQCDQCFLAVGSQGITIDWSRDNTGYHGAVGQEQFPTYYNNLNRFAINGTSYVWGPWFGNHKDGIPVVQPGDLAIAPYAGPDGDLDFNGVVDVFDLFEMLSAWGACDAPCPPAGMCPADVAGPAGPAPDCAVDVFDLFVLLGNWSG